MEDLVPGLEGVDQVHNEGMFHSRQHVTLQLGVHVNFSIWIPKLRACAWSIGHHTCNNNSIAEPTFFRRPQAPRPGYRNKIKTITILNYCVFNQINQYCKDVKHKFVSEEKLPI